MHILLCFQSESLHTQAFAHALAYLALVTDFAPSSWALRNLRSDKDGQTDFNEKNLMFSRLGRFGGGGLF